MNNMLEQENELGIVDPGICTGIKPLSSYRDVLSASEVDTLLDFSRQLSEPMEAFSLHQVIEEVISMIGYTMKAENIEIERDIFSSVIEIDGDSDRLKQVFINLIQNARDAMPDGGTLHLSTDIVRGDLIMIQFRDTGTGIDKDQLYKIIHSSYDDGSGAGMGLSECKEIIEEFGGTLEMDSEVGKGTVVSVKLSKWCIR